MNDLLTAAEAVTNPVLAPLAFLLEAATIVVPLALLWALIRSQWPVPWSLGGLALALLWAAFELGFLNRHLRDRAFDRLVAVEPADLARWILGGLLAAWLGGQLAARVRASRAPPSADPAVKGPGRSGGPS